MMIFTKNNLNNGSLNFTRAMPLKDNTSDNSSRFSAAREVYSETTPDTSVKKWFGSRDSSSVTQRRKNNAIGKGSINANNAALSFTSNTEKNTVNSALRRTRAGGATVPAKKTGYMQLF
jgi:hypothetical protein